MNVIKNFLDSIRFGMLDISVTYINGISSLRFNPHCGIYNNLFCVSSSSSNNFTIRSNLATRLLKNIYQRHYHLYLCLWFDWRRIYPIDTPLKKLERGETIKHTMDILIPVML